MGTDQVQVVEAPRVIHREVVLTQGVEVFRHCALCGENYSDVKDPYHRQACLEARKP